MKPAMLIPLVVGALLLADRTSGGVAAPQPPANEKRQSRRPAPPVRTFFEVASAQTFTGSGHDLVTSFDCLHDIGEAWATARHIREALTPEGTWLIVEPNAGDTLADNLNPVRQIYYSASTVLCAPNGLSQPGGYAPGAQAREAATRRVITDADFTPFRRPAETPFNLIHQVLPQP